MILLLNHRCLFLKVLLLEKIELILQVANDMQITSLNSQNSNKNTNQPYFNSRRPTLFLHFDDFIDTSMETNINLLTTVHQEAFFGRTCGFQYNDELKIPMTLCSVLLAAFNERNEETVKKLNETLSSTQEDSLSSKTYLNGEKYSKKYQQKLLFHATKALFKSPRYLLNPELRAKKVANNLKNATIDSTKLFWKLTDSPVVYLTNYMVTPTLAINIVKTISLATTLKLPKFDSTKETNDKNTEYVNILPPVGSKPDDTIKIRILSDEIHNGMVSQNY
jgi:hypothetical protein